MKYLPENTPCQWFDMGTPIWNGGKKVVGLDTERISKHNEITFSYVRKRDGKKSIPDHYYFDGDQRDMYPRQNWYGKRLVLVPFTDLEILTREKPKKPKEKLKYITDPKNMPPSIARIFFNYPPQDKQTKLFKENNNG